MARILHLSDLHLPVGTGPMPGRIHNKVRIRIGAEPSAADVLRQTCSALVEKVADASLDAVVISGDVTHRNAVDGFRALAEMLEPLRDVLAPERIVAVPGNHDVARTGEAGGVDRYARFIEYCRNAGFVTPFLEGVDDPAEDPRAQRRYLLLAEDRLAIVPINSSNWCGVESEWEDEEKAEWERLLAPLPEKERELAWERLKELRLHDMGRVSDEQFAAVDRAFAAATADLDGEDGELIRAVVLHHQLLPVGRSEELKPFETSPNLGELRDYLRARQVHIVVHGHKHAPLVYRDQIVDYEAGLDGSRHEVLVVAGSAFGGVDSREREAMRLIDIEGKTEAPHVSVTPIAGVTRRGDGVWIEQGGRHRLWQREDGGVPAAWRGTSIVSGRSLDEVYDRMLFELDRANGSDILHDLVCEIRDPSSAGRLPARYPEVKLRPGQTPESWFDERVEWWQQTSSRIDDKVMFKHGERIFDYWGIDQLKEAAGALNRKRESSRATIALFNPRKDLARPGHKGIAEEKRDFPAFCLLHFHISQTGSDPELRCTAFFRKQEMRYWWPVNVAEIAKLQQRLHEELRDRKKIRLGSITTVSAIAQAGSSLPRVAIPEIDLALDLRPEAIWELAYALFWEEMPERRAMLDRWTVFLDDLIPDETPDPDGVPVATGGLAKLIKHIEWMQSGYGKPGVDDLLEDLRDLLTDNERYLDDSRADKVQPSDHTTWRGKVVQRVGRIKGHLAGIGPDPVEG